MKGKLVHRVMKVLLPIGNPSLYIAFHRIILTYVQHEDDIRRREFGIVLMLHLTEDQVV